MEPVRTWRRGRRRLRVLTSSSRPRCVDLKTGRERQLTNLGREFAIADFDLSVDGREIIFDRAREESDIVVFDLPQR
jgi:hypothetical protein